MRAAARSHAKERPIVTSIYRSPGGRKAIASWCRDRIAGWSTELETATEATSLGETFVLTAGSGAPPVLLVPGTSFTTATWLEVVDALAVSHRVVAVDVPGQPGLSTGQGPAQGAVAYGDWLCALVEEHGLAGGVVVGHSRGGQIALAGAARGANVAGLALFNPAGLFRVRVTPRALLHAVRWMARPSPTTAAALLDTMSTQVVPAHLVDWMTLVGRHVRTSLAPAPLPDAALRRVGVPVRASTGSDDTMVPPGPLERSAARLADVAVHRVDGAGHLLPIERPHLVAEAVTSVGARSR